MDIEALFKVSYGLYLVCSGDRDRGNGFVSNTFFQVSSEPALFASCCNKNNFTASLIKTTGAFSVSVLDKNASPGIIGTFGYRSGKDIDKLKERMIVYGKTGVPVVKDDTIATLELKLVDTYDAGTHFMFIGELVDANLLKHNCEPLTYAYYREVKKGLSPPNAPTYIDNSKLAGKKSQAAYKTHRCLVCQYVYDEEKEGTRFTDLPDGWVCPVCGADKCDFEDIK